MLYKRAENFFTLKESTCNICKQDLILKRRKRRKDGIIYYQILKCSNLECITNNSNSKIEKLKAFLPEEISKVKILKLKNNLKINNVLNIEFWINKGYTKEEAKSEISKHQAFACSKVKNHISGRSKKYLKSKGKTEEEITEILSKNALNYKYWISKGYNEEEAKKIVSEKQKYNGGKYAEKRLENPLKYKYRYPNTIHFWTNKGYTKDEAKEEVKKFQTKFSLDICIEKYGKEKGLERWKDRQKLWLKNYKKSNFSKISQEMFWDIYNGLEEDIRSKEIYFATLNNYKKDISGSNNEYRLSLDKSYVLPDFFIKDFKLIIEFDGDYFHGKEYRNIRDFERDESIIKNGYYIFHVKEFDYNSNKEKTIKEVLNLINSFKNKENVEKIYEKYKHFRL